MTQVEKVLEIKNFGRWSVQSRVGNTRYVQCLCVCGTSKNIRVDSLVAGESNSCGCHSKKLISEARSTRGGISKHRLYGVWHDAQRRCFDEKRKDYLHYGGRGITMCSRWNDYETGFKNFLEDMESDWAEGLELERIDCDGDYEPSNCCWVTRKQQTNNLRRNRKIHYKGISLNVSEWSDLIGVKSSILSERVCKLKWSDEEALKYDNKRILYYESEGHLYKTVKSLLESFGIQPSNTTTFFKKFKGGKEGFLAKNQVNTKWSNERRLEVVIEYLTEENFTPDWETDDLLYIKNKYKYYLQEDV